MRCASCSSLNTGTIAFAAIKSGLSFHYCRSCEYRWWIGEQGTYELPEVLKAASVLARAS